jgi:TPR repeat protein
MEVRLINVTTEEQIWAENYDRELKDIFKTQSDIAENVALALKSNLSPEEKAVLGQKMTNNPEAYDLYLKGMYEYRTYTRNGVHQAIEYFQQAIALDSGYALANAGLAGSYIAFRFEEERV